MTEQPMPPAAQLAPGDVADWLKLKAADEHLPIVCAAVEYLVDSLPDVPRLPSVEGRPGAWAPTTKLAAVMLAARLHRRRNSPSGVEAMTEGGATYVSRYDSDIARMLRIDGHTRPAVG